MSRLAGKVAWITGAGSGIGEATALALAAEAAAVVLTGRRKEPLEEVAELVRQSGGVGHVQPGDMSQSATGTRIADYIEREFGRLDILVNNAGTNIPARSWQKLTSAGVDEVVGANLLSSFYGVIAALPMMRRQKDGVIINMA